MKIHHYPDEILRKVATPITSVTEDLVKTGNAMMFMMKSNGGIGLAAQQVGLTERIIVIDTSHLIEGIRAVMFNPVITRSSRRRVPYSEGCLSFVGITKRIARPQSIVVQYIDIYGQEQIKQFHGMTAVCIQHEINHLDGILFTDLAPKE